MFFDFKDEKFLIRSRLNEIIQSNLKKQMILISGPMSYGKTSLIKSFISDFSSTCRYISLESKREKDVWNDICLLLEEFDISLSKKLKKAILYYEHEKLKDIIKDAIFNIKPTLKNNKYVLILDDFDNQKFANIYMLIRDIIYKKIDGLCIILITRKPPLYEYMEMETRGYCYIMDQTVLQFNCDEIIEYANLNGEMLTFNQAKYIYDITKGWILLVRLLLSEYKNFKNLEQHSKTLIYVKDLLFNRQTDEVKNVVLQLMPLDSFSFEQVIYIIEGHVDSALLKNIVENQALFLIDKETGKYSIYPLLKEGLNQEFRLKEISEKHIFLSCGEWFESLSDFESALFYYTKAQEYDKVVNITKCFEGCLPTDNNLEKLKKILSQLPEKIKFKNRNFYLSFLLSYIIGVSFDDGRKLYEEAKRYYLIKSEIKATSKMLGELSLIESILKFNNIETSMKCLKRAYKFFDGKSSDQRAFNTRFFFGMPGVLFLFYRLPGTLKQIIPLVNESGQYFLKITNNYAIGYDILLQSEYNLLVGNYEKAVLYAKKAVYLSSFKGQDEILLCSFFVLLRVYMVYGNEYECDKLIKNIKNSSKSNDTIFNISKVFLGYFYGCTGNKVEMLDCFFSEDLNNCKITSMLDGVKLITQAFLMILNNEYIKLDILSSVMRKFYQSSNKFALGVIYSYIFECISKWNNKQGDAALKALSEALRLCEVDDIVSVFIEVSLYILKPLEILSKSDIFAKRLLGNCKASKQIFEGKKLNDKNNKFLLTNREIEVIKLVIDGYKQAEIAQKLYVSVPTIKKHIQKIYRKFGVNSKSEAIKFIKNNSILNEIILKG